MSSWQSTVFASVVCICMTAFAMFFVWILVAKGSRPREVPRSRRARPGFDAPIPPVVPQDVDRTIVFPKIRD